MFLSSVQNLNEQKLKKKKIWVSKKLEVKNSTALKFSFIVNEGGKQSDVETKRLTDIQNKSTNIKKKCFGEFSQYQ